VLRPLPMNAFWSASIRSHSARVGYTRSGLPLISRNAWADMSGMTNLSFGGSGGRAKQTNSLIRANCYGDSGCSTGQLQGWGLKGSRHERRYVPGCVELTLNCTLRPGAAPGTAPWPLQHPREHPPGFKASL